MRAALARHDALLRHCIEDHDGHVFKTGATPSAPRSTRRPTRSPRRSTRSVRCSASRGRAAKLRVRMALHSGAVELRDGDYFGAPLNRVARLLAAGHGGQTLLSESTHDLCRDHLPPLASVKSLGAHALKDLGAPEAVFQLCHPDLPQAFRRSRSLLAPVDGNGTVDRRAAVRQHEPGRDEYFTDGLADELLNVLSKIRGLRVASRTSAFTSRARTSTSRRWRRN